MVLLEPLPTLHQFLCPGGANLCPAKPPWQSKQDHVIFSQNSGGGADSIRAMYIAE